MVEGRGLGRGLRRGRRAWERVEGLGEGGGLGRGWRAWETVEGKEGKKREVLITVIMARKAHLLFQSALLSDIYMSVE